MVFHRVYLDKANVRISSEFRVQSSEFGVPSSKDNRCCLVERGMSPFKMYEQNQEEISVIFLVEL